MQEEGHHRNGADPALQPLNRNNRRRRTSRRTSFPGGEGGGSRVNVESEFRFSAPAEDKKGVGGGKGRPVCAHV